MTTPPEVAAARHMASRSSSSSIPKDTFSNKSQQNRHQHHRDPIYRYSSLAAGIASGIVSSLVVAPLDLIRTRLQIFHSSTPPSANIGSGSSAASSAWRMLRDILQKEGIKGCFRGLTATLITVPVFWGVYCAYTYMHFYLCCCGCCCWNTILVDLISVNYSSHDVMILLLAEKDCEL